MPTQIQVQPAAEEPERQTPSLLGLRSARAPSLRGGPVGQAPPQLSVPPESGLPRQSFLESVNWCYTNICLLFICTILLSLVIVMSAQVGRVSRKSKDQMHLIQAEILVLTEILRQLQTGKVHNCSVCKVMWVQHADACYLFRRMEMSWFSSRGFCRDESSALAVVKDPGEMAFLKLASRTYLGTLGGPHGYGKFWIGLKYDDGTKQWAWADGTPHNTPL
ncbi:Natural killer cells antigen CD94 [Varanus komodoensis]|nr:Natural killer cells antigen CD94 [Varanus komodoensis]